MFSLSLSRSHFRSQSHSSSTIAFDILKHYSEVYAIETMHWFSIGSNSLNRSKYRFSAIFHFNLRLQSILSISSFNSDSLNVRVPLMGGGRFSSYLYSKQKEKRKKSAESKKKETSEVVSKSGTSWNWFETMSPYSIVCCMCVCISAICYVIYEWFRADYCHPSTCQAASE